MKWTVLSLLLLRNLSLLSSNQPQWEKRREGDRGAPLLCVSFVWIQKYRYAYRTQCKGKSIRRQTRDYSYTQMLVRLRVAVRAWGRGHCKLSHSHISFITKIIHWEEKLTPFWIESFQIRKCKYSSSPFAKTHRQNSTKAFWIHFIYSSS